MNRDDASRFLLYCEPTLEQKGAVAIDDEYTMILRMAMSDAVLGTSNYSEVGKDVEPWFKKGARHFGNHRNCDDVESGNYDLLLPNNMITNSLCVYYLMWYRLAIPPSDWEKLKEIQRYYGRVTENLSVNKKFF